MTNPNRRTVLRGGLIAAATTPLLAGAANADGHVAAYPVIGQRVVPMRDRVIGIGAASTTASIRSLSADILAGKVQYSDELIGQLVWASDAESTDPRGAGPDQVQYFLAQSNLIMDQERKMMDLLRQSELYWVQNNPVFLLVVPPVAAAGAVGAIVIYPFFQGFFQELGSRAAAWLWDQLVD